MDKQTSTQIPINTRTIGAPEGIYMLYLEDYVHTFFKKLLASERAKNIPLKAGDDDYNVEPSARPMVALYGRNIPDNGRCRLVVSGAACASRSSEAVRHINEQYFPSCTYIGAALIGFNKDFGLRLELMLDSTRVVLDDFYIYYDQNEEMQNYLIQWNAASGNGQSVDDGTKPFEPVGMQADVQEQAGALPPQSGGRGGRGRGSRDEAAHLGRIAQAYNREEAKVSFMWNVMNVLCLGFVVCFMAYGIISINNYGKMQDMQESIDYCLALLGNVTGSSQTGEAISAMQQEGQTDAAVADVAAAEQTPETAPAPSETTDGLSDLQDAVSQENLQAASASDAAAQETVSASVSNTADTASNTQDAANTPHYYVVQPGDTLRTICFEAYGNYDRVDEICELNGIENPNNIFYGQKLLLP